MAKIQEIHSAFLSIDYGNKSVPEQSGNKKLYIVGDGDDIKRYLEFIVNQLYLTKFVITKIQDSNITLTVKGSGISIDLIPISLETFINTVMVGFYVKIIDNNTCILTSACGMEINGLEKKYRTIHTPHVLGQVSKPFVFINLIEDIHWCTQINDIVLKSMVI